MGLNLSRVREPSPTQESSSGRDSKRRYQHISQDESARDSNGSFMSRCCDAIFRRTRKRRRSEGEPDSETSHQRTKILRLDAATEIDISLQIERSVQVTPRTAHVQVQTECSAAGASLDSAPAHASPSATPQIQNQPDVAPNREWLDFPFLRDSLTKKYFQISKVMLIMRGLPGSGKSFLAKQILETHPQGVRCSADDFFMVNGEYRFQANRLTEAHAYCQHLCEQYCSDEKVLIVVDNTNVKRFEMVSYFKLAQIYRYLIVLVEPQTPWKMDVRELVKRNSHGVDIKSIRRRANDYEMVMPRYLGWFLNRADSIGLIRCSKDLLVRALLSCKEFHEDFRAFSGCDKIEEMIYFYTRKNCVGLSQQLLHITSRFFRFKKGQENFDLSFYDKFMGLTSNLSIAGFCITKETLGAKLVLDQTQLGLWEQNDHEISRPDPPSDVKNGHSQPRQNVPDHDSQDDHADNHLYSSLVHRSLQVSDDELTQSKGRRAHITIGTSGDVRPVQTGLDTIQIMNSLQKNSQPFSFKLPSGPGMIGGTLIKIDPEHWFLKLERYLTVNAIFTGSY